MRIRNRLMVLFLFLRLFPFPPRLSYCWFRPFLEQRTSKSVQLHIGPVSIRNSLMLHRLSIKMFMVVPIVPCCLEVPDAKMVGKIPPKVIMKVRGRFIKFVQKAHYNVVFQDELGSPKVGQCHQGAIGDIRQSLDDCVRRKVSRFGKLGQWCVH